MTNNNTFHLCKQIILFNAFSHLWVIWALPWPHEIGRDGIFTSRWRCRTCSSEVKCLVQGCPADRHKGWASNPHFSSSISCSSQVTWLPHLSLITLKRNPVAFKQSFHIFPTPSLWQPLICFLSPRICLFKTIHINDIIQYATFRVWLLSPSIMLSRFIYVIAGISTLFLFMAE